MGRSIAELEKAYLDADGDPLRQEQVVQEVRDAGFPEMAKLLNAMIDRGDV
jgi:hypothetical protein